ncbi:protein JTB-like isoform X2 [Oncorhynchus nerka]|uniref:protein JTB-like isoform X2 n=1 Tax=Oncorhynchus nerka TaxID=8023 RepID=UPI0011314ECC|nr:protein JTB-like isoform X2 [Oncorhynchus nerka]
MGRMESDCRIPMLCLRPRVLALHALFWGLVSLRVFGAALLSEEKITVARPVTTPCWQMEEFVVAVECSQCNAFQSSWAACTQTGYVERINCTKSNKDEYKSCRSTLMEEHLFWKFEGAMLGLTILFALVVVARQRSLDRLASEKVRRQIESI